MYDAIVIGGGFYGTVIASYLVQHRGFSKVAILEQESELMRHASYHNQARIHGGYHYPRSLTTALRSRVLLPKFTTDFSEAVFSNFTKLYAIAKKNSKVNARQFVNFCNEIKAPVERANNDCRAFFDPRLIEDVFVVQETAFNALQLHSIVKKQLTAYSVEIVFNTKALSITKNTADHLTVTCNNGSYNTRYVFNCTYSGINQLKGDFTGSRSTLKHEITEMPLVQPPPALCDIGITIMDGPFFSMMPFPAKQMHSLSHVRYTPHISWLDNEANPYDTLKNYPRHSQFERMQRDCTRYMPILRDMHYVESMWECKTILVKNENDDGRPILFETYPTLPNCYTILGGKIDNIYDVLERLNAEPLTAHH